MMKRKLLRLIYSGLSAALVVACASQPHLFEEYQEALQTSSVARTSDRTVLVILIDGLPQATLQEQVKQRALPGIQRFFLGQGRPMFQARSSFPSLTFPGVGALVTEQTEDGNGLFGNVILLEGEKLDFESPLNLPKLNRLVAGQNIFARLGDKGLKTISVAYSFNANATTHMEENDVEVATAIQGKNYSLADGKLMHSMDFLLEHTEVKQWPDFIFLHLIGVDLTSHDQGSKSKSVTKYLKFLDSELAPILKKLEKAETLKQRRIVGLLTSDHGFDRDIHKVYDLEQFLSANDTELKVLNEGRVAGIYFPAGWNPERRAALLRSLIAHPAVDIVAEEQTEKVLIQSRSRQTILSFAPSPCAESTYAISVSGDPLACPSQLSEQVNQLYYPYFINNISHYFRTPGHPDAVIIAKPGVAFKSGAIALHGGPTPEETLVPLLMHNCTLTDPRSTPELSRLLRFL